MCDRSNKPYMYCPGLFHGKIPLPIHLSCDIIHFILGLVSGLAVAGTQYKLGALFIVYQAAEELLVGDVKSFVKDVFVFVLGFAMSMSMCSERVSYRHI